jgi:hypothetical protein
MAQVKAFFLVPVKDNDGRDLGTEIEELRAALLVTFGGWSFLGHVQGAYRMASSEPSFDLNQAYTVILDESRLVEPEQLLRDFKSRTLQEAVYLEIHRDVEIRLI